jgi:hypothetical protein
VNNREKLVAAIERLETLRDRASRGPWKADVDERGDCVLWGERGKFIANVETDHRAEPIYTDFPGKQAVMFDHDRNDALLMETLHRTIDAQLEILRGVAGVNGMPNSIFMLDRYALHLADAILGEVKP